MALAQARNRPQGDRPSGAEMMERARAMIPALKERAAETEKLRQLHPDTVQELHDTGLFRLVQPERVGGGNHTYRDMIEATVELGRGCGSTAWVYVNLACHHWMLAMWPPSAQDRVWDENPDALIASSVIFPAGQAKRVTGGYELTGRWPFCSGVDLSGWVMLGGTVAPPNPKSGNGGAPDRRMFLVPASELTVIDTWDVSGLCGTGSKDVALEGAFVAGDMTLGADQVVGGATPGSAVNPGSLYMLPVQGLFPHIIAAPIVGMVWGATDDFIAANRTAQSTYNASKIAHYPTLQIHVADAAAAVEAARTMLYGNCDEATAIFDAGAVCSAANKHRWRRDATFGANRCADAMTALYRATGGKAAYKANPVQRSYRDVAVGISHISMSWDVIGAEYGSFALGVGGNPNI